MAIRHQPSAEFYIQRAALFEGMRAYRRALCDLQSAAERRGTVTETLRHVRRLQSGTRRRTFLVGTDTCACCGALHMNSLMVPEGGSLVCVEEVQQVFHIPRPLSPPFAPPPAPVAHRRRPARPVGAAPTICLEAHHFPRSPAAFTPGL